MPLRRILSSVSSVLLILTFVAALVPSGCAPSLPPEPEWERNAHAQLERAETFLSKRQYEQASKTAEEFLTLYPKSRYSDRALFLLGEIRLTQRNFQQALSYYKELIEKYPSSPLIYEAKYRLGGCYFELKEFDLAIANLEDRSGITDPAKLQRVSEMLAIAYVVKQNYPLAVNELLSLLGKTQNEKQQAGYRDRVREIVDKYMTEDQLKALSAGKLFPADIAELRLIALLVEQRKFQAAIDLGKDFLDRFSSHPEKARVEMLLNQATTGLTQPRFYLGALLPQTGELAFFGDRVLKGIQLAVNTYNLGQPDSRVELIVKDTAGSPEKAVTALGELAAQGVVAVIGPVTTKDEEFIAPSLEKLRIPVIRPAASRAGFSQKSDWIFRNALTIDSQVQAIAQYALGYNLKQFVILYPDEAYGKDLSRLFARELQKKGELLASVPYPPDTRDFGPYIKRIIEIDLRSRKIQIPEDDAGQKKLYEEYTPGFNALYLPGYADSVGLLIPQLAFYNVTGITMLGSDNWHSKDLIERAGRYADGAVFVDGFFPESTEPPVKAMVDAYRSAFQENPDILSAQAYDAAMMVFSLLQDHKETPVAIRDGLLALQNYPGITGLATFAGNREAQKKLFLIKVENGAFTLVDSTPANSAK